MKTYAIVDKKRLKSEVDRELRDSIVNAFKAANKKITEEQIQKAAIDYKMDSEHLIQVASNTLQNEPNISDQDLVIRLLTIISKNKKYRKMAAIAQEMIQERWWEKK
ncbi:hypothetical protein [Peribacillus frigoritolerans]|uniref:hypothetical protein n=1 Tax=Peribacillus castrilensis TaxID=2897690 RepID=UPI00296F0CCE|nr:hypothetical protein [Peribacillus castrilensis]